MDIEELTDVQADLFVGLICGSRVLPVPRCIILLLKCLQARLPASTGVKPNATSTSSFCDRGMTAEQSVRVGSTSSSATDPVIIPPSGAVTAAACGVSAVNTAKLDRLVLRRDGESMAPTQSTAEPETPTRQVGVRSTPLHPTSAF